LSKIVKQLAKSWQQNMMGWGAQSYSKAFSRQHLLSAAGKNCKFFM
jgi:hypothetical protein